MIAPELVVTIAHFLPTASDMFRYLMALPTPTLTKQLQSLRQLFILQSKGLLPSGNTYEVSQNSREFCQINLWPFLKIPYPRVEPQIIKLFGECIGLYSRIELHAALQCFDIPPSAWFGVSVVGFNHFKDRKAGDQRFQSTVDDSKRSLWNGDMESALFDAVVYYLSTLPRLQHITMDWISDDEMYLKFLQRLECFKHLTSLELLSDGMVLNDEMEAMEKWCTSEPPKKLTLYCELAKRESEYFKCVPQLLRWRPNKLIFRGKELVGVRYGVFHDETGKDACDFVEKWNGEILTTYSDNVNYRYLSWDWELPYVTAISRMSNLRVLFLQTIALNDECCQLLEPLLPQLDELSLIHNGLREKDVEVLVKALPRCKHLHTFILATQHDVRCPTAIGIANAIASGACIRSLDLSNNQISDKGAIALSHILHYLDDLYLDRNYIGVEGATAISKVLFKTCYLTTIDLKKNSLLSGNIDRINAGLEQSALGLPKFEMSQHTFE